MLFVADIQKKSFFDLKEQDLASVSAESQNNKVISIFLWHREQ